MALAADITVDGTTCTLYDAIVAANTDAVAGGCDPGSGYDTLMLTKPTYSLDGFTALPSITTTIVMSGGVSGATIQRIGSDQFRLLYVGSEGDLTLQNITVQKGPVKPRAAQSITPGA